MYGNMNSQNPSANKVRDWWRILGTLVLLSREVTIWRKLHYAQDLKENWNSDIAEVVILLSSLLSVILRF